MDQFTLENAQRYQVLVDRFKPAPTKGKPVAEESNPDITIATRLRPMLEDEKEAGLLTGVFPRAQPAGTVDLHELRRTFRGAPGLTSFSFRVDRVFGSDDTTEAIYKELVKPLVPWAWGGGVSTMFAYGQTGSGKTYTVSGLERLIAETLFSDEVEGTRSIFISIIELAGNSAFDLLNSRKPVCGDTAEAHQQCRLLPTNCIYAEERLFIPLYAICKIRLENTELPQADDGLLYLIDLAGSEAARDVTAHSAERMKEAREINASLSVLKDCIRGRASIHAGTAAPGKKLYVPFRQSALTKVLKHVFDPAAERSCKTVVVACVNPSFLDVGASKNTLRYGEMLRVPVPKAVAPKYEVAKPSTWSHEQLQEWIGKNSGTPAVSAEILAPQETGKQLLRLPVPEFITRCLKTPDVTMEQATAFQSKFWRLHLLQTSLVSTAFPVEIRDPEMSQVPFKERIRPGMVVSWNPPDGTPGFYRLPGRNLVTILSPEDETSYRCASVVPGVMPGAFEVYLWQQVVAKVEHMETEVLLEYDVATRYYYETL
ncbi:hypothetical protein NW754_011874 [Fusarium falciforme]|nr:hypothetical protein NW754_011874 [Fusarium falciforme]